MKKTESSLLRKDGVNYLFPFLLVTTCIALWGFVNDITNPMVKVFSKIFRMSVTDGALVQMAFYGGYFAMVFPAALFIRKYSYKASILLGLALYAVGAFLFFPAKLTGSYYPFLLAYFILTCGLSFLETSANPYILSMGPERRRRADSTWRSRSIPWAHCWGCSSPCSSFRRSCIRWIRRSGRSFRRRNSRCCAMPTWGC